MKPWSRLQMLTHVLCWLPLAALVAAYLTGNLTVNPIQAATQRSGDIALVILILSLAMTPLHTIFNLPKLLSLRRPLGLYAFFYATLHMLTYTGWDYSFDFPQIYASIAEKPYLIFGLLALALLTPLAITSHRWWQKKLNKAWKRLHRLVYLTAGLAVLHLAWVVKGDVFRLQGDIWKPLAAGIALALLLMARIPPVRAALAGIRRKRRVIRISTQSSANPTQK